MKAILFSLFIAFVSGCASVKNDYIFDGATIESTKQGIGTVVKRLKPAERVEFMMALLAIQFSDVSSVYDIIDDPTMTDELNYYIIGKKINGLNYQQVLELAKSSPTKVKLTSSSIR